MSTLSKNQKRKKKLDKRNKAHRIKLESETIAYERKFKEERKIARKKIVDAYRADGMSEELIKRLIA